MPVKYWKSSTKGIQLTSLPSAELIDDLIAQLFPLNRGLAGEENRSTLRILSNLVPVRILEVASGTSIAGWRVPQEWSLNQASIRDSSGRVIVTTDDHPLHLLSNSVAVDVSIEFDDLEKHLVFDLNQPERIPYRTLYYQNDWGFSVSKAQFGKLKNSKGPLTVQVDSTFTDGSMSIGEIFLPGERQTEVLISTYICHPHMANDGLSGMLVAALLADQLAQRDSRRFSYRFVFAPETIGTIFFAHMRQDELRRTKFVVVATTTGGDGDFVLKQSFREKSHLNFLGREALRIRGEDWSEIPFDLHGSDERQYSSPGLRLECISFLKPGYYRYPQYHSSDDNISLVTSNNILDSLNVHLSLIDLLENERYFIRKGNLGEPRLSEFDLYPKTGGGQNPIDSGDRGLDEILGVLFWSDGETSVLEISRKLGLPQIDILKTCSSLEKLGLLEEL